MADLHTQIKELFAEVGTLSLATVDDGGKPYAANVNFAADDDLNLYFLSNPASVHSQHVTRDGQVAGTAYPPFEIAAEIRGVQFRGICETIPPNEFKKTWELFVERHPYAKAFEERARSEQFYRIKVCWIRLIDNRVSFGHKQEAEWPVGEQDIT